MSEFAVTICPTCGRAHLFNKDILKVEDEPKFECTLITKMDFGHGYMLQEQTRTYDFDNVNNKWVERSKQ
jgi:hypothetical protein